MQTTQPKLTTKTGKPFKQTPEARAYFKAKAEKNRLKKRKCECGQIAVFKNLDTKKQFCAKCAVPEVKQALNKIPEPKP